MFRRYSTLLATLTIFALAVVAPAQSKFQLKVHTGRGANGYDVNSTMISGEKDMLLIDPQFSLSEAHRLAAPPGGGRARGSLSHRLRHVNSPLPCDFLALAFSLH